MKKINLKLNSLTVLGVMSLVSATFGLSISAVQSQSVSTIKIDGFSTAGVTQLAQIFSAVAVKSQGSKLRFFGLLTFDS